jgi:transposase
VTKIICGLDVSARWLDARIGPSGAERRFGRSADGIAALAAFCRTHQVDLVVMEATGGYEKLPFALLWAASQPCALANPRQVRRFAEAIGRLEKTDRIDAGIIAHFAATLNMVAQPPASPAQQHLQALSRRLHQLTDVIVAQTNQRRLVEDATVLASFDELIALLRRQARALEAEIMRAIEGDPLWRDLNAAFRQIKGVANRSVARLLAELPEIGTFSGKAIAKLVGLAPLANDSGEAHHRRCVRGGRAAVRSILVTIATVVARYDQDLGAFHRRLIDRHVPRRAARLAVARKLLVRLNAKARDARKALENPAPA